jgi:hypothetical protein
MQAGVRWRFCDSWQVPCPMVIVTQLSNLRDTCERQWREVYTRPCMHVQLGQNPKQARTHQQAR